MIILFGTEGSRAAAQDSILGMIEEHSAPVAAAEAGDERNDGDAAGEVAFVAQPVVQTLPAPAPEAPAGESSSLGELVQETATDVALSEDMRCLAGAIYFESKGEPLAGQLAVGRVIVNRAQSTRFPASYCGVVYQRSQFSFVRGGRMPTIKKNSKAWRNAVAIAQIADAGTWESPAEGALFFHARYVSPGWRLQRVAQVKNHIFYR